MQDHCLYCSKFILADVRDSFMLTNEAWRKVNPAIAGVVCLECSEQRLGRALRREDITDCLLSSSNPYTANLLGYTLREWVVNVCAFVMMDNALLITYQAIINRLTEAQLSAVQSDIINRRDYLATIERYRS